MEEFNFNVTASAFKRLFELAKKDDYKEGYLIISVDGGGCSGFSYNYKFQDNCVVAEDDFIVSSSNEAYTIHVVVDSISKQFLDKSQLNFISTLGQSYFEVKNPNAKVKCGCGNSFGI